MMVRRTILAAVVFAALFALLIWDVRREGEVARQRLASSRLLGGSANDLTLIMIHNAGLPLRLERGANAWRITQPIEADADPEAITALLDALNRQERIGPQKATVEEMQTYGLNQPPLKVELKTEKGDPWVLLIGEDSPVGGQVYARLEGSDEFFTIGAALRDQLQRPLLDYRDRRVVGMDVTTARHVSLTAGGSTVRLAKDGETWRLLQPLADEANQEAVVDLLHVVNMTRAIDFIDTATLRSAGNFGLEAPSVVASFALEDPAQKPDDAAVLLVGLRRYGGAKPTYYARRKSSEKVFTIPQDVYEKLQLKAEDLRSRRIFTMAPKDVTQLSVRYGRSVANLARNASGAWEFGDEPKGPAESAFVEQTLAAILKIEIADFLQIQPLAEDSGMDAPSLSLTLTAASGKKEGLETGRPVAGRDMVYARRPGGEEVFMIAGDQPGQYFLSREDFEPKNLFAFAPADVATVEIKEGDRTWSFHRQQDSWLCQPSSGAEAFQVKSVSVQRFIEAMQMLRWKRRIDASTPEGAKQVEGHGLLTTDRSMRLLDAQGKELAGFAEGDLDPARVYIRRGQNEFFALEKPVYELLVDALKYLFAR